MKSSFSLRLLILLAPMLIGLAGCGNTLRQDMANQPRQNPLSPSDFFPDGRSERPVVENTVVRGAIADDALFVAKDSNAFPLPVDMELLERGRERYAIFCSPCHGLQGDGNGMVAVRGMKHPPSFHDERLRHEPNGYFYDVIPTDLARCTPTPHRFHRATAGPSSLTCGRCSLAAMRM